MQMTKKLTGREAVIALMDGKTLFTEDDQQGNSKIKFINGRVERLETNIASPAWNINYILQKDWEIVSEPMTWEGEEIVQEYIGITIKEGFLTDIREPNDKYFYIKTPESFKNKRVKVRIEEIL